MVEKILAVRQHLNAAHDLAEALQQQLVATLVSDSIASRNKIAEVTSAIAEQERIILRLSKQDNDMTVTLQLGDAVSFAQLEKMKHHAWFEHQLNMRALKACIIAKVCEKNFETQNLTGAFRSKAIGMYLLYCLLICMWPLINLPLQIIAHCSTPAKQ